MDLDEVAGSCAAILCGGDLDAASAEVALRAPAAVIAVAVDGDEACQTVYERTLFPASRIVGCSPAEEGVAEAAFLVARAAVLGAVVEVTCSAMRDGRFQPLRVVLGPRGVERVISSPEGA